MSHGVGTYQIDAFWEGGNLIYYEKSVGHTATGDVFTIGTEAVKVGGTLQDVDFQWYGTGSKSFILNLGAATAVSSGLAWTITGDLAVTGAITLTGDVSLEGDLTLTTEDVSVAQGKRIYLDGQDGGEYLYSDTANDLMLNATTNLNLAIGGTDEVRVTAAATAPATNDGNALGTDSLAWSDLYLASGAIIAFNSTDVVLTHSSNTLTLSGGDLAITAGNFVTGAPVKPLITNKSGNATLTPSESGLVTVSNDGVYIYLPALASNTGIMYFIKNLATYTFGIYVGGNGGIETVDGSAIWKCGAENDAITVLAGASDWHIISKIGTWTSV